MHDTGGKPFLLLTGPEPDHEWDLFALAIRVLSDKLKTGPAISFLGIPAGVPHTRPLGVIAHGTRDGLAVGTQRLPDKIELPGSATGLLELRLGEAGRDALGFAVQVPHYLAQAMYPAAALTLLESVRDAADLDLPGVDLQVASERTNEAIQQQITDSAEVAELVQALEQQYDAANEHADDGLLAEGEQMPTADELAAQFEQFLADQQRPPDQQGG
jgi:acyl carrier protein